jgi:nitric oxide dioxygenase
LLKRGIPATRIRYEVFGPDLWAAQIPAEPVEA